MSLRRESLAGQLLSVAIYTDQRTHSKHLTGYRFEARSGIKGPRSSPSCSLRLSPRWGLSRLNQGYLNCFISDTRFEGATQLHAVIDTVGRPTNVIVTNSSGSPVLDQAAVVCLQKAHFQAAVRDGKPVEGDFHIGVKWELPPSANTCSPSMPVAWMITVSVAPPPGGSPAPLPPNPESLVCVCVSGTELSEPIILRSSGAQRLDDGAIKLIKKSPRPSNSQTGCYAEMFRFNPQPP